MVHAARILGEAGDCDTLQTFAIHLSRGARTPSEHLLVSQMGLTYGAPHISVKVAKRASRSGVHLVAYNYPISFGEAEVSHVPNPPELALLLGLVRQESEMNPLAVSRAGAYGLMQLKPSTAKRLSRALGVAYSKSRLTRDPGYNITLGSAYLSRLLEETPDITLAELWTMGAPMRWRRTMPGRRVSKNGCARMGTRAAT